MDITNLSDRQIAAAILCRNAPVTKEFLYVKCYPLFKTVFCRYHTDCESIVEFINEIYMYLLYPSKETGKSKLASFGFRCTLTIWLKIVVENYCRQLYSRRIEYDRNIDDAGDSFPFAGQSLHETASVTDKDDVRMLINAMPNVRYRRLMELRYLEERSNEETALMLNVTLPNYYNMHKRAKQQFCDAMRKEGLL